MIELRDVLPSRSVARHAFGETRPGVAVMRLDENIDLIIAREGRADLVVDDNGRDGVRGGTCEKRGNTEEENGYPHPPLTHGSIVAPGVVPASGRPSRRPA